MWPLTPTNLSRSAQAQPVCIAGRRLVAVALLLFAPLGVTAAAGGSGMAQSLTASDAPIAAATDDLSTSSNATTGAPGNGEQPLRWLADIRVHSADELGQILNRVDRLLQTGAIAPGMRKPVVFLLHGNEARVLFKKNYLQYKAVVDTAARLSAFAVVDIKVCEQWMGSQGLNKNNLQPFVKTVPFAPAAKTRLLTEQDYVSF